MKLLYSWVLLCSISLLTHAQPMRWPDRVRLAEAARLNDQLAERLWPGWQHTPKTTLLVTDSVEYLVWYPHATAPAGMRALGYDSLLQSVVYVRPQQFNKAFLATFPAFGGVNTIVIGTPENTSTKTSGAWVMTWQHEHFHQWQYSLPGYQAALLALDLAGDDQTGMWMLNYPFPYADAGVSAAFDSLCAALRRGLQGQGNASAIAAARQAFYALPDAKSQRYWATQTWQEGVAQYTETRMAQLAAQHYTPTAAYLALPDYAPLALVADKLLGRIHTELAQTQRLGKRQRTVLYTYGAAEALWLDRTEPDWRSRYAQDLFFRQRWGSR